jgi:NADH:ubiquinone oxidoreductase subunit H
MWAALGPLVISYFPRLAKSLLILALIVFISQWIIGVAFSPASKGFEQNNLNLTLVFLQIVTSISLIIIAFKSVSTNNVD